MSRYHLITAAGPKAYATRGALAAAIFDLAGNAPISWAPVAVGHPAIGRDWVEGVSLYFGPRARRDWFASAAGPDLDPEHLVALLAGLLDRRACLAA